MALSLRESGTPIAWNAKMGGKLQQCSTKKSPQTARVHPFKVPTLMPGHTNTNLESTIKKLKKKTSEIETESLKQQAY